MPDIDQPADQVSCLYVKRTLRGGRRSNKTAFSVSPGLVANMHFNLKKTYFSVFFLRTAVEFAT